MRVARAESIQNPNKVKQSTKHIGISHVKELIDMEDIVRFYKIVNKLEYLFIIF